MKEVLALFVTLIALFLPLAAHAAVFNVSDAAGLQQALMDASLNAEDDTIEVAAGTYDVTVSGTLLFQPGEAGFGGDNHALTVNGAGQGTSILDGGGLTRVLVLDTGSLADDSGVHLTLSNLSIVNGLTNTYGDDGAGAVMATVAARVTITNTTFAGNRCLAGDSYGGALVVETASGEIVLAGNTFSNNQSYYGGGGAYVRSTTGAIAFTGNSFVGNASSDWVGGGAYVVGGSVSFESNDFAGNNAVQWGGGLYLEGSDVTLNANTFSNNTSNAGAGAYMGATTFTLTNNIFTGNVADAGSGGGVRLVVQTGTATLTSNTFVGNSAAGMSLGMGGGAFIRVLTGSVGNIYNNILWGNSADQGGNDGDDLYVDSDGSAVNLFNNDLGASAEAVVVTDTTLFTEGANITADCNLTANYDLVPGSPCLDSGDNGAPALPPADGAGKQRIYNGIVDIGAREYIPPPEFADSPSNLQFLGVTGAPNPRLQILTIANAGGAPLNWTATASEPWISLSIASGTDAGTIRVTANTEGLPSGTHAATIDLAAPDASPVSIAVTLILRAAITLYVDAANTSGVEDGTAENPFNTIQEALAEALGGDTVLVLPGTYYGAIQLVSHVYLLSQGGPEVTVIDAEGTSSYTVYAPYLPPGEYGYGYIEGFTVLNTGGSGLLTTSNSSGKWDWNGAWLQIDRCILRDISGTAIMDFPAATVKVNHTLVRNVGQVVYVYYGHTYLTNVTVDQVDTAVSIYHGFITMANTTVSNVGTVVQGNGTATTYGSDNNFWNFTNIAAGSASDTYTDSLNVDPLFVNPPDDYNLQDASPLIDAGIDVGLPFFRAAPDIGAYENTNDIDMDVDDDGHSRVTDCNDNDPFIYPGAPESCDGIDNNCDGQLDEGFGTLQVCAGACQYTTIQSAVDAVTGCETVLVDPGIYFENVDLGTKRFTLKGAAGAADTFIDGSTPVDPDYASVVTVNGPAVIEGFTIQGGRGTLVAGFRYGAGIYAPGASPLIKSCTITGNIAEVEINDNSSAGGGIYADQPIVTNSLIADNSANRGSGMAIRGGAVRNSVIRHNGWGGIISGWGGGIELVGTAEITNCLVVDNQAGEGAGIRVSGGSPTITNTTIANNSGTALSSVGGAAPNVVNSIIWGGLYFEAGGTLTASYSDILGGYAGTGNIEVDPQFVNAAAGDYRLGDASPCRDAGTGIGAPTDDLLGTTRPQGSGIDIGAYEWLDSDSDGYGEATDCNNANASIRPGATESCDGIDNNCDGQIDEGFGTLQVCAGACQYTTIQSAIDAATSCETVLVDPGTYFENITFGGKSITLRSSNGPATTIIDGGTPTDPILRGVVYIPSGRVILDGFTLQNGKGYVTNTTYYHAHGAGVYAPGATTTIRNCVIRDCVVQYTNLNQSSGGGVSGSTVTIENSEFYGNYAMVGSAISMDDNSTVRNCSIHNNGRGGWGGGISLNRANGVLIENTLFYDNLGQGSAIRLYRSSPAIRNCTFVNNGFEMIDSHPVILNTILLGGIINYNGTSNPQITFTNIQGGYAGMGNIDVDSQFVNEATSDYRLGDASPCRDAGTVVGAPAADLLGVARPQGMRVDIGAYEWYDGDGDGYSDATDCNDADAAIRPGAPELCDALDNNCNSQVDEGLPSNTYYQDSDGDGYGNDLITAADCVVPEGYVADNTDCDDTDFLINPGAAEVCDSVDNNCDGQMDEIVTLYLDADGDSFGDILNTATAEVCFVPVGYVSDNTDCDDNNPEIRPGAAEICGNSIDENCDGVAESCTIRDVSITSIRVPKKVSACSTRSKKVRIEITNRGEFTEMIRVQLTIDGTPMDRTVYLNPGSVASVAFDLPPALLTVPSSNICVDASIGGEDLSLGDNSVCRSVLVVDCL